MLYRYEVDFSIDGRRTKAIVVADSQANARKLIEAQYRFSKLLFFGYKNLGKA